MNPVFPDLAARAWEIARDELFVPIQAEFFALQGLGKLLDIVQLVRRRLNPNLAITAMVSTMDEMPSRKQPRMT